MRKYVVIESATVKDALVAINNITHDGELLIVVNSDNRWLVLSPMAISVEASLQERNSLIP